jgi:hypothetical protein
MNRERWQSDFHRAARCPDEKDPDQDEAQSLTAQRTIVLGVCGLAVAPQRTLPFDLS